MSSARVQRFETVLREVHELLVKEWAPLGFAEDVSPDEYEPYAMQVISRLAAGASEDDIAAYLAGAERSIRGDAMSTEALRPLAKQLMPFREAARGLAL